MKEIVNEISSERTGESMNFEPIFFDLSKANNKLAFKDLLKRNPDIQLVDTIHSQLRELISSRNPQSRISAEDLEGKIQEHTDGDIDSYGRWVYYPWLRKVIHLLGEEEFIELRTNRNRNKITEEEHQLLSHKIVGVVGLSVGKTISVTMAMERSFGEIRIADHDSLDLSNLNRLQTGVQSLGLPKTVIAAREIYEIDPYLKVKCFHEGLTEDNLNTFFTDGGKLDMIVDECDGLDIKILLRFKARELGIPVLMDMNDRGTLDVERFDLEPNRPILHGMIDHLDLHKIKDLSNIEKIPYILPMLGEKTISAKLKASMLEMGFSLSTWPQLSSSVMLGGAIAADTHRRIMLGQFTDSGRYWVDTEEIISSAEPLSKHKKNEIGLHFSKDFDAKTDLKASIQNAISLDNVRNWKVSLKGDILTIDFVQIETDGDFDYALMDLINAGMTIASMEEVSGVEIEIISVKNNQLKVRLDKEFKILKGQNKVDTKAAVKDIQGIESLLESCSIKNSIVSEPDHLAELSKIISEAEKFKHLHPFWSDFFLNEVLAEDAKQDAEHTKELYDDYEKAFMELSNDEHVISLLNQWKGGDVFKMMSLKRLLRSEALVVITENTHNQRNMLNLGVKLWEIKKRIQDSDYLWMNLQTIPLMSYNELGHSIVEECEVSLINKGKVKLSPNENFAFIGGIFRKNEGDK